MEYSPRSHTGRRTLYKHKHARTPSHMYTNRHTHITYIQIQTHANTHRTTHTYTHRYTHTDTKTRTLRVHTHIHIRTHNDMEPEKIICKNATSTFHNNLHAFIVYDRF